MLVTVQPKEGISERWIILIDGEPWKEVHRSIFGRHPKFKSCKTWQEWQKIFDQLEYQRVKNYVIWRLSSQSYHSEQLAKLLKERLVSDKVIKQVLGEFQESGYINNALWIENFIHMHKKRYSLRLIINKLRLKGLHNETLGEITEKYQQPEEELQTLQHLLKTRYASKNLNDFKEKQKVMASLMRKGFRYDQVQQALSSNYLEDSNL